MTKYWMDPRYLKLRGKTRLIHKYPAQFLVLDEDGRIVEIDPETAAGLDPEVIRNLFALNKEDMLSFKFLTTAEYDEMWGFVTAWFEAEIQRLEELGYTAQADALRESMSKTA